jgi:hypothetical protein
MRSTFRDAMIYYLGAAAVNAPPAGFDRRPLPRDTRLRAAANR